MLAFPNKELLPPTEGHETKEGACARGSASRSADLSTVEFKDPSDPSPFFGGWEMDAEKIRNHKDIVVFTSTSVVITIEGEFSFIGSPEDPMFEAAMEEAKQLGLAGLATVMVWSPGGMVNSNLVEFYESMVDYRKGGRDALRNGTTPAYVGPQLAKLYQRAGGESAWTRDTDEEEEEEEEEELPRKHPGAPPAKRQKKK